MTFVNALLLTGLVGVGLPVLIHFLTRARPRTIRFPTYHLLVESGSGTQRLSRLRTWTILALRTLAVLALVLMFARPVLRGASAEQEQSGSSVVLVVDASASMTASEAGVALFDKARAEAADALRGLPQGTSAAVVWITANPRPALPALSQNLAALHDRLSSAQVTHEAGEARRAVALAAKLLEGPGVVHVFSDFQAGNWDGVDLSQHAEAGFVLHPVTESPIENVGITSVETAPAAPVVGETAELAVTLFNASPVKRAQRVRLRIEGVTQERQVELMPFSPGVALFEVSMPTAGVFVGQVSSDPDALAVDDTRAVRLPVRDLLKVLLISDSDPADTSSSAYFVARALEPGAEGGHGLKVDRRRSHQVDRGALETADLYVVVSPTRLTGESAQVIGRRVAAGVPLMCFLDGQTAGPTLSVIAGGSEGALEPSIVLQDPVRLDDAVGLVEPSIEHPALRLFAGPGGGDLTDLHVRRFLRTQTVPGREQDVLLQHATGDAALVLTWAGAGSVAIFNLPVSPSAGDVAGHPLFPALVHEVLRQQRAPAGGETARTPGRELTLDVPSDVDAAAVRYVLRGPAEVSVEPEVLQRGARDTLAVPPLPVPGRYDVVRVLDGQMVDAVAVHVDARETDTRPVSPATLSGDGQASVAVASAGGTTMVRSGEQRELWPWLLAVAAAALLAEMLLLGLWRRLPQRAAAPQAGSTRDSQDDAGPWTKEAA